MPRTLARAAIAGLVVLLVSSSGARASRSEGRPAPNVAPDRSQARTLAFQAYEEITSNVFRTDVVAGALEKLTRAHDLDPEEPWVYMAASKAMLVQGYLSGDWSDRRSFAEGTVDQATVLARKAIDLAPSELRAHTNLASFLVIQGQYEEAAALLEKAKGIDSGSFYPWYGEAVLALKQGELGKAETLLREAASRAGGKTETILVIQKRQSLARARGDLAALEKLLEEAIAADPEDAWKHGMYADFLMGQARYGEAVTAWEKAVRLTPFPHAVTRLAEAKRLRDMPKDDLEVAALLYPKVNAPALKAKGPSILPVMARLYERSDEARRTMIAYAFYTLGWKSPDAKRVLMRDVHTTNQDLRLQVQWALGRVSNDPDVVEVFSRVVPRFPVGSELKLEDGTTGVVSRVDPDHPTAPWVRFPDGELICVSGFSWPASFVSSFLSGA